MINEKKLYPETCDIGKRIDSYLSEAAGLTRSAVQNLIADKQVTLRNAPLKKSYKIEGGEEIILNMPAVQETGLVAQDIALDIVYEDSDIIVVNKPRGMVVHPAAGNWDGTLVNALMFHCGGSLSGINGELRPGIVHRIDKDTSGLLVVAKNDAAHQSLSAQIAAHNAHREYEAVVLGSPREESGTIDLPIARHKTDRKKMAIIEGGRQAITHYTVLARYAGYSHVGFRLETGRTHQIRVHMAAKGHPIAGDAVYGAKKDKFASLGGQCLHACKLCFTHPATGQHMKLTAPRPDYFEKVLKQLRIQNI